MLTLAHDAAAGGLAVAIAEAALWSGVGAEVELSDDPLAWFGEGSGGAVIACAREDVTKLGGLPLREIGVVGGDAILGVRLAELGKAWNG
jgi:phosphoribosylformylglycinamidine synthase